MYISLTNACMYRHIHHYSALFMHVSKSENSPNLARHAIDEYQITKLLTVENSCLPVCLQIPSQVEILKSRLAAQFAMYNHCGADF